MLWSLILLCNLALGSSSSCNYDGELLPNNEDCRRYFKCANGKPSKQVCPGTLIFDAKLKICNWPETTSCNIKPKAVKIDEDDLLALLSDDEPTAPTAKATTERNLEKFQSLFHTKDRDFKRLRDRHKNLRDRMRARARKEEKQEEKPSRNRITGSRSNEFDREEEESEVRMSFGMRGSLRDKHFNEKSVRKSFQNRFSSRPSQTEILSDFNSEEDQSIDTKSFRNRGSSNSRNRGDLDDLLSSRDQSNSRNRGDLDELLSSRDRSNSRNRENPDQQLSARDRLRSRIRDKFSIEVPSEKERKKAKKVLEPIRCSHDNELHANPQNCRKYFKCSNGQPSLQSCPTNLIYDDSLKVCNWPESTECYEDPDAILPELGSSDRHPPRQRVSVSDNDVPSFSSEPPRSSNNLGTVPTRREAQIKEEALKQEYPLFEKVKETVRTLDTEEVELIKPNRKENPDNVRRVEFILSEENYEELFPRRHSSYTYTRFIQAIGIFPSVCSYVGNEDDSDAICRKTLATMFAHFAQETGAHNPSDKEYDEWRQGLAALREQGCTDTSPGCGYNENCEDKDSITKKWACGQDRSGKWKKYYGRGAKQLSYNFNYGQFSQAMFGDGRLLLDHPDLVADTWLNLASATWFYATPQPPKPSMLHVIDGTWVPNQEDRRNGINPGFGATINIINGGLECNTRDGRESKQAANRIKYYKQFAWYLYVDYEDEELGCASQQQFSAGGAGALPLYWDKDWQTPYSCKLVTYQTAHSALVQGEYVDCVEELFNVKIT